MASPVENHLKLKLQAAILGGLVIIDLIMFAGLMVVLSDENVNEALAALLGALAGGIIGAIGMGARDFFSEKD